MLTLNELSKVVKLRVMTTTLQAFKDYRGNYCLRQPDLTNKRFDDEVRLLTVDEGLGELSCAPAKAFERGVPPGMEVTKGINKYLWVIANTEVPIAVEEPGKGTPVDRGYLSHTNLTGGASAYCGGELWFIDDSTVILNGGSSRYPPREAAELEGVAFGFKAAGYRTATMGWNSEAASSFRSLRGDPQWI